MRKISEIFYSLQGEGANTGVPSVFVRFSGCNLKCPFCDTNHQNGTLLTDSEIITLVNEYPAEWIVLTGGEPSLFIDADFVHTLHVATGKKIAIETNGCRVVPDEIDWITLSPKTGIAEFVNGKPVDIQDIIVQRADELKVVNVGQDLDTYFTLPQVRSYTRMYLQPCFVDNITEFEENIRQTVDRVKNDPRWILSLQTHRFINIP